MPLDIVIEEKLCDTAGATLHRGRRSDGTRVIVKVLRGPRPAPGARSRFRREFEILRRIRSPHVVEALDFHEGAGTPTLVLEDFGGTSLDLQFASARPTIRRFLEIAIAVVDGLSAIHEQLVIHKDINPSNVVASPDGHTLKIIDFGIASTLAREAPQLTSLSGIEGTLLYISPEQTGRMNRPVDYRSDYYSLGATLYRILTGRPPFDAESPIECVYAHLARTPRPPHELDPTIPAVVSAIVMRLLAKTAEARYQSAFGIRHDLERCLATLTEAGDVPGFALGARDASPRVQPPSRLYGREAEVDALVEAYGRAASGALEVVLVGGYSGIGKTSLVNEVQRHLAEPRGEGRAAASDGNFVEGKFDQFNRERPYSSLLSAFGAFLQRLMSEREEVIATYRARIQAAVDVNGAVLTPLMPELLALLGAQPEVPALDGAEAENRFYSVFMSFFRALSSPEHPLVLFMDDLQWADLPSIRLLSTLARSRDHRHLLLLGAYRDNEVDAAHPLALAIEALRRAGAPLRLLTLEPLSEDDSRAVVADAIRAPREDAATLASLCFAKTQGNPFFLNQFLESLHSDGLLRFVASDGRWAWDAAEIESRAITDNVVELMATKIRRLSEETERALTVAAFLGARFDLATLASLLDRSQLDAAATLREALTAGLVTLCGRQQELDPELAEEGRAVAYQFVHDRVQQAAYSLFGAAQQRATHHRIGRLLLDTLAEPAREQRLFEIVNHLNLGATETASADARRELADLNRRAGVKAKSSAAYGPALTYLRAGIALIDDASWELRYDETLELHLAAAETAQLSNDYAEMDRILALVAPRCRTAVDEAACEEIRVYAHVARHELKEAVTRAISACAKLGVELPEEATEAMVGARLGALLGQLAAHPPESILALPRMTDRGSAAAMRILANVFSAAYYASPLLVPIIAFCAVEKTLERGVAPESAPLLAVFALVLCSIDMIEAGDRYADLALALVAKHGLKSRAPRAVHIAHTHVRFWRHPIRECMAALEPNHHDAFAVGDFEYAAYSGFMFCYQSVLAGVDLGGVLPKLRTYTLAIRKLGQDTSRHICEATWQYATNLASRGPRVVTLSGDIYEDGRLAVLQAANDRSSAAVHQFLSAQLGLFFRDLPRAHAATEAMVALKDAAVSIYSVPVWHSTDLLILMSDYLDQGEDERRRRDARAAEHIAKLRAWAGLSEANLSSRVRLCEAELARVAGDALAAEALYVSAIEAAVRFGSLCDEGLANELAARAYLARGARTAARAHLQEASYAYERWGAAAKVAQLAEEFGDLVGARVAAADDGTLSLTSTSRGVDLDLATVLKVSQAFSSEIRLGSLLERVVEVLIENAGATRGLLLMDRGGELVIEAESTAGGATRSLQGTPAAGRSDVPLSIVTYVSRTGETLVLDDARLDPRFNKDAHVAAGASLSVLSCPVVHQGKRAGILYVENALTTRAFTADRVRLLSTLTSQAAISIENASLYARLNASFGRQIALTEANERFVPREFIASLGHQSIDQVALGDSVQREMTVLFSDMRAFSRHVEGMTAEENIAFINEYLAEMEPGILSNGGFVDSYIGDAIMALFPGEPAESVRAAIAMHRGLVDLNASRRARGRAPIAIGVGLNTGALMLGTIGGPRRIKCGVIGDCVNLAARIESLTKTYGAGILIGEQTLRALPAGAFLVREVDRVRVVGRVTPVTLYEVFDAVDEPTRDARLASMADWELALARYGEGELEGARDAFARCRAAMPDDVVVAQRLRRCERYLASPPPGPWTGVEDLTHK